MAATKSQSSETLGALIRRRRMERRLSLRELGRDVGVSGNSVSGWERGRRVPAPEHLPALAKALRIRRSTLIERADAERLERRGAPRINSRPYPPDDEDEQIGWRIRQARMSAGVAQWRIAKTLGVTQSQLSAWERGYTPCPGHRLEAIADLCGVTAAYLRGEVA